MKNRIAAGWTISQLWDRMLVAESGEGYSYDYVEQIPLEELERANAGRDS